MRYRAEYRSELDRRHKTWELGGPSSAFLLAERLGGDAMKTIIAGLAVATVIVACLGGAAFMFRYEPMPGSGNLLWDRWKQNACVAVPLKGLICSQADIEQIQSGQVTAPPTGEFGIFTKPAP